MIGMLRRREMMAQGEYTFVNALIGDGTACILTDIVPYDGLNFECLASLKTAPWKGSPAYDYSLFGCDINYDRKGYGLLFNNTYSYLSKFLGLVFHMQSSVLDSRSYTSYLPPNDTFMTYKYENGNCYVNNSILLQNNTFSPFGIIPMAIMGLNRNGNLRASSGVGNKISYLRLYDAGGDVHMLRAAIRNADGEVGMLDTITNVFYTNSAGAGAFGYE